MYRIKNYPVIYCNLRWKLTLYNSLSENNATKQFVSVFGNPHSCIYRIAQNAGRVKLWHISLPSIWLRKILANLVIATDKMAKGKLLRTTS